MTSPAGKMSVQMPFWDLPPTIAVKGASARIFSMKSGEAASVGAMRTLVPREICVGMHILSHFLLYSLEGYVWL